jgi:hypothetical protein
MKPGTKPGQSQRRATIPVECLVYNNAVAGSLQPQATGGERGFAGRAIRHDAALAGVAVLRGSIARCSGDANGAPSGALNGAMAVGRWSKRRLFDTTQMYNVQATLGSHHP